MGRWVILLILGFVLCLPLGKTGITGQLYAAGLEYYNVYTPQAGMPAEEIMRIKYFVKYAKFCHDIQLTGHCYFIDKTGFTRERSFLRQRIILGRGSDGIVYKDLVAFTAPGAVKGLATLTWSYIDAQKEQNQWIWLPSLKKIRKISAAQSDDSFMGSDFTVEEITSRRYEDEAYSLLREENFKGYRCEFDEKLYFQGSSCFVIEAKPKKSQWYYSKRIVWIDKNTGGDIFHEIYDSNGQLYKTIFKNYEIINVEQKDYPTQMLLEAKDLRAGHRTVLEMKDIKYDQGLPKELFTEKSLMRSRW